MRCLCLVLCSHQAQLHAYTNHYGRLGYVLVGGVRLILRVSDSMMCSVLRLEHEYIALARVDSTNVPPRAMSMW